MEIPSAAIRRAYGVRRTLALSTFTSGILRGTCQRSPIFALLWGDATPRSFLPGGHRHRRLLDCGSALTVDVREQRRHFLAVQPQVRHADVPVLGEKLLGELIALRQHPIGFGEIARQPAALAPRGHVEQIRTEPVSPADGMASRASGLEKVIPLAGAGNLNRLRIS